MKKHILMFVVAILAGGQFALAYSFSATAPSGQTLYYDISGNNVKVTAPGTSASSPYSGYAKPTGDLVIPDNVTYNGTTYTVTSIGIYAFRSCSGLTSVTIPNSVTSIGIHAFNNCSGLRSVTIGNSVTSIGRNAFYQCTYLTSVTIPNSVISIGIQAFCGCRSLTSVTIGNSVTNIGEGAFGGCKGLAAIYVESGNTHYDSRNNCNAIIETSTNTLIAGCFNTVIPNSVTSIGNYAFYSCYITSATIPNSVTSIGNHACAYCPALTSVTIPNSVTSIGNEAFRFSSLSSITIPNSVTSIGEKAFYQCISLTKITSLAIAAPLMGANAFYDVSTNIPVYVPCGSLSAYQSTSGWNRFTNIQEDCSTPGADEYDIRTCTGQTLRFKIDDATHTATVIGYVGQCNGGLTIPAWFSIDDVRYTVTAIGPRAFENCRTLESVILPRSITLVDEEAFKNCSALITVNMK